MKNLIGESPDQQVSALKARIGRVDHGLANRFWNGEDTGHLIRSRSKFVDGFLTEIWQSWFDPEEHVALFAVGGYGRGELHPHSDIDLLVLVFEGTRQDERIAKFVRLLWDLNLVIGHSVRTVADCKREAKSDLTVMTSLMERRHIAGSNKLAEQLSHALASKKIWSNKSFFEAKRKEQDARHVQWGDIEYGLEPDVKHSPGGLRDVQTIGWITKRHYQTDSIDRLREIGILTQQECDTFTAGRLFLWRVRFALHLLAGRKQDHLAFHRQRQIAEKFSYTDSDGLLAVEKFMRDYYRHVLELREVNDILIQNFNETILHRGHKTIQKINERFQVHGGYIEAVHDQVFAQSPYALMEIFVILANNEEIAGVRASTIRLIRENLYLIDKDFRENRRIGELFLELLRSPYTLASHLTRMRRYGILGRYIPAFGRVIGQMQHDLFHIYTVDAHTIMTIRHMRRLFMPRYRTEFPFVVEALQHIAKVELLFLAGFFHDIGKGRGGDHSELGSTDAKEFCQKLGLTLEDTALVEWLVRHHLTLSTTAQREDIDDPDVIEKFAALVGTESRLSYLVALTVADINATNPSLWNGWRASLIGKLYRSARQYIRAKQAGRRVTPHQQTHEIQQSAQTLLEKKGLDSKTTRQIWEDSHNTLISTQDPERVVAITWAIHNHDFVSGPLVLAHDVLGETKGEEATELFVCAQDRPLLFASCVSLLDQMHLQVLNARIETGNSQMCYDSFIVLDVNGDRLVEDAVKRRVCEKLRNAIQHPIKQRRWLHRRVSRQLTQFVRPATVSLTKPNAEGRSTLELVVSDRPGLLALVGEIFVDLGVELHEARIATLGERVEDLFEISSANGQPIHESERMQTIVDTLTTRIDAAIEQVA